MSERDWADEKAAELVKYYWEAAGYNVIDPEPIATALRAAAAVPAGCVRDDKGVDRKVLMASSGPLWYLTTDGCVVPNTSAFVFSYELAPGCRFTGKIIAMKYQTWFDNRWDDCLPARWTDRAPDGVWGCYSTREAAQAALAAREGK